MNKFARPLFEVTQYGLANQILNIAICETQGYEERAFHYFDFPSNFELTIEFTGKLTLANAQEYFDGPDKRSSLKT